MALRVFKACIVGSSFALCGCVDNNPAKTAGDNPGAPGVDRAKQPAKRNASGERAAAADPVDTLDRERLLHLFDRPPSFSFVAIPGDATAEIPRLLSACRYQVRQTWNYRGNFFDLYPRLERPWDDDDAISKKAWYRAGDYTVLVDPEMVLNVDLEQLSALSRNAGGVIVCAIWERASETVILKEIGASGIVRQSWYCQGRATDVQENVHAEIAKTPNSDGLLKALADYGLRDRVLFGEVEATVAELQWSRP